MKVGSEKIRDYLLGNLSQNDTEEIDLRVILDESMEADLVRAEDELIEDYLDETLSPDDLELFQKNFLVSNVRKRQVEYIHALREYAKKHIREASVENLARNASETTPDKLRAVLRYLLHPVPASIAILVVILTGAFGWWLLLGGSVLTSTEKEFAALNERDLSDLALFQSSTIVNLVPGTFRDRNVVNTLLAGQVTDPVLFRLGLQAEETSDQIFSVRLIKNGVEVVRLERVAAYRTANGVELRLVVPSSRLTKGEYVFNVKGKAADGPAVEFLFMVE